MSNTIIASSNSYLKREIEKNIIHWKLRINNKSNWIKSNLSFLASRSGWISSLVSFEVPMTWGRGTRFHIFVIRVPWYIVNECAQNKQEQICKNNYKWTRTNVKNMHNDNHLIFKNKNKGGGGGVSKAEWLLWKLSLSWIRLFMAVRSFPTAPSSVHSEITIPLIVVLSCGRGEERIALIIILTNKLNKYSSFYHILISVFRFSAAGEIW